MSTETPMKTHFMSFLRRYFVPRRELDTAIAYRDAIRRHFKELQEEYLKLESKMMSQTGYDLANVDVNIALIEVPSYPRDEPFSWRVQCQISRELAVALREEVNTDLLPYIAENFKRHILQLLVLRWEHKKG